ncbi:hypothetical protein VMCG_07652 [Cytospora schulzeri]|uniref:Uncharacterized protein n=1 Tax=Cytospora schulzeri TaxID=448051 RepID=A0A423VYT2_9PEZI|nr:hypothetical protein VMCG_07652 [Valsa malicola]
MDAVRPGICVVGAADPLGLGLGLGPGPGPGPGPLKLELELELGPLGQLKLVYPVPLCTGMLYLWLCFLELVYPGLVYPGLVCQEVGRTEEVVLETKQPAQWQLEWEQRGPEQQK